MVVDGLGLSGKTKALVDLATRLDRTRWRPAVAQFDVTRGPLHAALRAAQVPVFDVPCREGLDLAVPFRLARLLRTTGAAVAHAYNPRALLYSGLAAALVGGVGVVGSLSAFACQVPDREYEFLPDQLITTTPKNRLRNALAMGLAGRIAVVSPTLGGRFCQWNGLPDDKLRVVTYGVTVRPRHWLPETHRQELRRLMGVGPEHILVASVGRLVEQKDYPTQLRAFAQAAAREPALRMALIGDGPLRAQLQALAQELRITEKLTFVGHRTDVPALLASLDVFVMASKFEPYGVAILEAKAAGVAIVATAVNELPEILSHGQSGALVPAENPAAMADAFVALARDPQQRQRLADRAYTEAADRHSLTAMVAGYENLYSEVVRVCTHVPSR